MPPRATFRMSTDARPWFRNLLRSSSFRAAYPAYTYVLARLDPVWDPEVAVMAVSAAGSRLRLHINPDFFVDEPQFLPGVLLHEVHHVVLGHLSRPEFRGVLFPDLMTLAMEMSANEYIREPLPGTPVTWEQFAAFGVQAGQSTLERYGCLADARRTGRLGEVAGAALVDDHGPLQQAADGSGASVQATLEAIQANLQRDGAQGLADARIAGTVLGDLLAEVVAPARSESGLDWRAMLAAFSGRLSERRYSYARPNRRFPQRIGEIPGYGRDRGRRHLVVGIDTSASMSESILGEIANEIARLSAHVEITVAEVDAAIQRVYPFRGRIDTVKGRGGTDLRPLFVPEFLERHRPDAIVYFTDGEGPWPQAEPGVPVLWVLSGAGGFACPWGLKAWLDSARHPCSRLPMRWLRAA